MVEVRKISEEAYEIVIDDQRVQIGAQDLSRLEVLLAEILRPESSSEKAEKYQKFLKRLRTANNAGIQALLRTATHDDILVLLHASEEDLNLKKKLFGNMSENSIKLNMEDILFQFREGVPAYRFDEAMTRLISTADFLIEDGALKLDKPTS